MKTLLLGLALTAAGVGTAQAQIYVPRSVANGALLGGIAGAIVGGHNNDRWGEGAVIGAAAGALIGAAVDNSRREAVYQPEPIQTARVVPPARTVPPAPVYGEPVYSYPPETVYSYPPEPTVVYVERPGPARVIYVERPVEVVRVIRPVPVRYYPRVVRVAPPPRWHRHGRDGRW